MLAYTDASYDVNTGEAVIVALLLSNDMFMGMYTERVKAASSSEAELYGVLKAIEFIDINYPESSVIKIKTDNEANVRLYKRYTSNEELITDSVKYCDVWRRIVEASKKRDIYLNHINSHLAVRNPNNVCDMLARCCLTRKE